MHDPTSSTTWGVGAEPASRTFGMVSTFPPTACGIATFAAALSSALLARGASVDVVRCGPRPTLEDPLVVASLGQVKVSRAADVDALNATEVVIVQHEYGIYDGPDGDAVLPLLGAIEVPVVLVAHTVVRDPTAAQRRVLEIACRRADCVVVMTATARVRLLAGFDVDIRKVIVIPHGAATPPAPDPRLDTESADNGPAGGGARLLTWGLLGPGKGIEWAIDALAELDDLDPAPTYLIAGATHPKVRARSGERYRSMLVERARSGAVSSRVSFDDSYRGLESLTELIRSADLVLLPYDSDDQVTSGVLVDAVAAGRPVVSTAFPHAVELLASGAGIVVPQRDPRALAAAIRAVVSDPDRAAAMAAEARRLAPSLSWASVAERYEAVATALCVDRHARTVSA